MNHYLHIDTLTGEIRYSAQLPDPYDISSGLVRIIDITEPAQPMEYEPTSDGYVWSGLNRMGDPDIDAMLARSPKSTSWGS